VRCCFPARKATVLAPDRADQAEKRRDADFGYSAPTRQGALTGVTFRPLARMAVREADGGRA